MNLRSAAFGAVLLSAWFWFVSGDRDRAEAAVARFYSQIQAADFSGARSSIDEAIRLWPDNARYYTWRAYAISQSLPSTCNRLDANAPVINDAIANYQRSLALNPRDAVAHHNIAWLLHLSGNQTAARAQWAQALAIDPGSVVFHISYGMFLDETGDQAAAVANYASAIALSPAVLDSQFFTRFRNRNGAAASAILNRLIADLSARLATDKDSVLKARLGKLYLYNGNLPKASALLGEAARDLPSLPLVWMNLGDVYSALGQTGEARRCFERARLLDPSLPGPLVRLGEFRQAASRWNRLNPITAIHNNRLYGGIPQQIDDLLPTTLLWYVSPCEADAAYSALAKLEPRNTSHARRSRTCEELPDPHHMGLMARQ